jgi:hypothetical protein
MSCGNKRRATNNVLRTELNEDYSKKEWARIIRHEFPEEQAG